MNSFYLANRVSIYLLVFSVSNVLSSRGSRIEFGAQQCKYTICFESPTLFIWLHKGILVRDDEAVEKLRKEVGEIGLIM